MYGRSVSTPPAQLRQDQDAHLEEKDQTKLPRRNGFSLSALGKRMVSGFSFQKSHVPPKYNSNEARSMLYNRTSMSPNGDGFWLRRDSSVRLSEHFDGVNSKCISATSSFRGTTSLQGSATPSFRGTTSLQGSATPSFRGTTSLQGSATPSFRGTTSLQGLSYVASFNNDYERSSYKGLSLEQAAKVVSSSTIGSNHSSQISTGCDSPCEVFASFSDDSEESESPLFDPDLLDVFERALEQLPVPSDEATSTNDRNLAKSSSDESSFRQKASSEISNDGLHGGNNRRNRLSFGASEGFLGSLREKKETNIAKRILEGLIGNSRAKKDVTNLKKIVCSVTSEFDAKDPNSNLLEMFPLLCPPGGEHKVVLFFTSLRGIRKTYENCNSIRTALFGFSVKIDERDVSMHSDFKRELKDLFGKSVSLPRLFIKGRYVGGVEEVMQLNEDGVLAKLLEDLPRTSVRACEGCGDIRFIPCAKCNGSCKIVSHENNVMRCPRCNENGLVRCTICC
ncbi:hypothetical protein O6H91_Y360000 [Diphasiastrum complanatum]|nr:hypothetical protein O6H91_Y360000 [Diphasiastrum complanatum]